MAARNWTPEQRQRQREAIQRWKPWGKSTGPSSPAGKAVVSRNGWKGGHLVKMRHFTKAMNQMLREQRGFLR